MTRPFHSLRCSVTERSLSYVTAYPVPNAPALLALLRRRIGVRFPRATALLRESPRYECPEHALSSHKFSLLRLWNFLILECAAYGLIGAIALLVLRRDRDEKRRLLMARGSTRRQRRHNYSVEPSDGFFTETNRFIDDLVLQYPWLINITAFMGRICMALDIGSDIVLVSTLFALEAGKLCFC